MLPGILKRFLTGLILEVLVRKIAKHNLKEIKSKLLYSLMRYDVNSYLKTNIPVKPGMFAKVIIM